MADTIMTAPLVSADDAVAIALGRKPTPDMITVEEFRARYGHEPSMTINVSEAARQLADDIDQQIAERLYAEWDKKAQG